jgi:AraC-like DNA-binding protein
MHLLATGGLSEAFNNESFSAKAYLLIVSRSNRTLLRVDNTPVNLFDNQMVTFPNTRQIKFVRGEGFYACFSGMLAGRYLRDDMQDVIVSLDWDNGLRRSVSELEACVDTGGFRNPVCAAKVCFSILVDLWVHRSEARHIPKPILDAVRIIENDYAYLFGVESVADEVGVNKSYLIRLFKEHLSVTPGKYLEGLRIDRAKVLLASGEFNMDMVAKLCGYSNANYFGKIFKKNTGGCPGDYLRSGIAEVLAPDIPPEYFV